MFITINFRHLLITVVMMLCSKLTRSLVAATLALLPVTSKADQFDPEAQLHTFATCAGRLSAVVEYEFMEAGAPSEEAQRSHDAVIALVAAVMSQDQSRAVLNWRTSAKRAQFNLLLRSQAQNQDDAAWAARRAQALTQECTALVL